MAYKVVLAGGSGYVGRHLGPVLSAAGADVVVLSRSAETAFGRAVHWDGKSLGPWKTEIEGAHAVINLSGVSVSKHWSEENKLAIQESRILSTRVLGEAISASAQPPQVWINASAIGYYGDRGAEELTESSQPGRKGAFLVDLCVAWENELARAETPNTRKVCMRIGVVFGRNSLAFAPLLKVTQLFLGGHLGSGRQYMSWIHVDDLVRLFQWMIDHEVEGPVNAVAPDSVTNSYLMATMRGILKRPWAPPVPAFLLRLVTFLGGPDASLLLESQRATPTAALESGFEYRFGVVRDALVDLILSR